jgi:hypothetical protein
MFDGHALALTGWLEAEQAVISLSGGCKPEPPKIPSPSPTLNQRAC